MDLDGRHRPWSAFRRGRGQGPITALAFGRGGTRSTPEAPGRRLQPNWSATASTNRGPPDRARPGLQVWIRAADAALDEPDVHRLALLVVLDRVLPARPSCRAAGDGLKIEDDQIGSFGRHEGRPSRTGAASMGPGPARSPSPTTAGCGPGAERNGALVDCRPPDPPAPRASPRPRRVFPHVRGLTTARVAALIGGRAVRPRPAQPAQRGPARASWFGFHPPRWVRIQTHGRAGREGRGGSPDEPPAGSPSRPL